MSFLFEELKDAKCVPFRQTIVGVYPRSRRRVRPLEPPLSEPSTCFACSTVHDNLSLGVQQHCVRTLERGAPERTRACAPGDLVSYVVRGIRDSDDTSVGVGGVRRRLCPREDREGSTEDRLGGKITGPGGYLSLFLGVLSTNPVSSTTEHSP